MAKPTGSVAPKERINIRYVPATGDEQAEVELPHKMLVMGDFGLGFLYVRRGVADRLPRTEYGY